MQWSEVENYLSRIFLDQSSGLPSSDVFLGIVFTIISFAIGWAASRRGSRRRIRDLVVDELILSQSELKSRAYPKIWKQKDSREAWMLDPFVARLRFLYSSVNESKALTSRQLTALEYYLARVQEFIAKWEETETRRDGYHYAYKVTYEALREATRVLGLKENSRLRGLIGPQDSIFGPMKSNPANDPGSSSMGGAMVPAE